MGKTSVSIDRDNLEQLIEVSGKDTATLQTEYERYVKDCVKKNREPFDPDQWSRMKLDERNSQETKHNENVTLRFRMLLEQSGFKLADLRQVSRTLRTLSQLTRLSNFDGYPMDTLQLGRHRALLGKPEEHKGICPLCNDALCLWSSGI